MTGLEIFVSSPALNSNSRAALTAFASAGLKVNLFSSIAIAEENRLIERLPAFLKKELLRRRCPASIIIRMSPVREIFRLLSARTGLDGLISPDGIFSMDNVCKDVDRALADHLHTHTDGSGLVYAYEDAALETLTQAQSMGLRSGYDLPIAYWSFAQCTLAEEQERYPQWLPTFADSFFSEAKTTRKSREAELADRIFVPSQFVLNSLPSQLRHKATIATFGSPLVPLAPLEERPSEPRTTLKLLFVGSLTQRKGLADLFTALKLLNRSDIRLSVIGAPRLPMSFYFNQYSHFEYHSPRSQGEVYASMANADLLVLPSLIEGCALVQQEALMQGVPLLVTPNTGGDHLVLDGITGFTVPVRSPEKLAERISWCADHRNELSHMRLPCRQHAEKFTWQEYGEKLLSTMGINRSC